MRRFRKLSLLLLWLVTLVLLLYAPGCSALNSVLYKADIRGESASITFNRLNSVKQEKISLPESRLTANVEASTQGGTLIVVLKNADGKPIAGYVVRAKESTKVEQFGPFAEGAYLIEIRGEAASNGSVKVSFTP